MCNICHKGIPPEKKCDMKKSVKVCLFISSMFVSFGLSGQEIYQSNAASASNETGTTSGWSHTSAATISVDNVEKHVGSSSIKVISNFSGWSNIIYQFTTEIGKTYDITIWAKRNSAAINPGFFQWAGFSNFQTQGITSTSWTKYDFSLTASAATASIKVYTGGNLSDNVAGQAVYIDGITITGQGSGGDTQVPTAPTALSSTGQTQTTIDLDWTAATDDVGVTGYKVFRNSSLIATLGAVTSYTVTGLTAGTQCSFHVTALDAANNESVASSSISAATDTASGGGSGGL